MPACAHGALYRPSQGLWLTAQGVAPFPATLEAVAEGPGFKSLQAKGKIIALDAGVGGPGHPYNPVSPLGLCPQGWQ